MSSIVSRSSADARRQQIADASGKDADRIARNWIGGVAASFAVAVAGWRIDLAFGTHIEHAATLICMGGYAVFTLRFFIAVAINTRRFNRRIARAGWTTGL